MAATVSTLSCGAPGHSSDDRVVVTDSAGITIITSSAPADADGWRVEPEPMLSIGVVDGPAEYQLFRVTDAMRLPDGRIVLVNGGTRDVRIYGADGVHTRTIGGPGRGPEEYSYPTGLLPTDTGFIVLDRMDQVHYDAAGDYLGRTTFDQRRFAELMATIGRSEGGGVLRDGSVLAPLYEPGPEPKAGPPFRPAITVVRADPESGVVDTLAHIGGTLQQYVDVGGRPSPNIPPFAPSGRWGAADDGAILIYDGALPQVQRYERDGTHRIIRWQAEPEPVTAQELDELKAWAREVYGEQGGFREVELAWAVMDMPSTKPYVEGVRPTADGGTWVRVTAHDFAGTAEWQTFDGSGVWTATVTLPATFSPLDIGSDYVLGIYRDPELQVETLRVHRVSR
ncbi:MAG: hypothetical protein WD054_00980 [Gemmatimonadota bacterium]